MPAAIDENTEKKELFERIESSIIELLKENLQVSKEDITSGMKLDFSKRKLKLPQISLNNVDFSVEEIGMGSDTGVKKEEASDAFTGDGKTSEFKFSKKLHSLINVKLKKKGEDKWKIIKAVDYKENFDNFKIDYNKGLITFRTIPEKETDVQINYYTHGDFSGTKGLKFNLNYNIDVFAENDSEVNRLCTNIIKILLLERTSLADEGILITLAGGESINNFSENLYGKSLKYLIETEFIAELPPLKKIGEVDIRSKREQK